MKNLTIHISTAIQHLYRLICTQDKSDPIMKCEKAICRESRAEFGRPEELHGTPVEFKQDQVDLTWLQTRQ